MKIHCNCGNLITDNTDNQKHKGHLIADTRWWEFWEAIDAAVMANPGAHPDQQEAAVMKVRQLSSLFKSCWECTACGRIYFDEKGKNLNEFLPKESEYQGVMLSKF